MPEPSDTTPFALVLTTAGSQAEAEVIASALIEAQLAACVSVFPMQSIYTWEGKVQRDAEWQLVIKTRLACFEALSNKVKSLHSYDTPELITLPISAGSAEYLSWMGTHVQSAN